jgi:N utilization substance protein B
VSTVAISTKARRRGREEAFKLLFQADQGVGEWDEVLSVEEQATELPAATWAFARDLAAGAWRRRPELDPLIDRLAHGWSLDRMAAADRSILRLAVHELLDRDDIPVGVSINEAVELAKIYGTDDSPRFINGILGALVRERDIDIPEQADAG